MTERPHTPASQPDEPIDAAPSAQVPEQASEQTSAQAPTQTPKQQVHERWWWTGTFRAVLGIAVIGYQWSAISAGEAQAMNWVVAAAGAAVVVWGLSVLARAWRSKDSQPTVDG